MRKVLIVDDETPIREWMCFCLQRIGGYEAVGAGCHGAEGYSLFKKYRPDIVITDIRMPVMDGLEMMKMIGALDNSVYFIILTSHDDFSYAREALKLGAAEYVLKTEITEQGLRNLLRKAEKVLDEAVPVGTGQMQAAVQRNTFLRSLALRREPDDVSDETLRRYGITMQGPVFAIALGRDAGENGERDIAPPQGIENLLWFSIDLHQSVLLGNVDCISRKERLESCFSLASALYAGGGCSVGMSDIYESSASLHHAIVQAVDRLGMQFYTANGRSFVREGQTVRRPAGLETLRMQVSRELLSGNLEKAGERIEEIVERTEAERPADIAYVRQLFFSLLEALLPVEAGEGTDDQLKALREEIDRCQTFSALAVIVRAAFREPHTCEAAYSYAVRQAISYLKENYARSVGLTDVAEYVELSPEYLSRIFKEETGTKFVVYLANLRLQNAVRLLESTNLKVYEVAEASGYANLSYFSTIFKKRFGMNPFDYKNKKTAKD